MKNSKIGAGIIATLNLGIVLSIAMTIVLFVVPYDNSLIKFVVSLLVGTCIGLLVSMVMYLNKKLNSSTIHDELTGLYNANFLNECKFRVISQTDRQQGKMGLVIADVNRLKDVVNQYGGKVGDEVLKYVSEGLTTTSRASEFIFRLDSDNFLIFFSDINEYSNIKIIKSRLETFFQKPLMYNDIAIDIKLDFGYAVYPEDGSTFEEVHNVAEQRMYIEKSR